MSHRRPQPKGQRNAPRGSPCVGCGAGVSSSFRNSLQKLQHFVKCRNYCMRLTGQGFLKRVRNSYCILLDGVELVTCLFKEWVERMNCLYLVSLKKFIYSLALSLRTPLIISLAFTLRLWGCSTNWPERAVSTRPLFNCTGRSRNITETHGHQNIATGF